MKLSDREELGDAWKEENDSTLLSPSLDEHWEQIVLFPDRGEGDYAVEADLTLLAGKSDLMEAGIILRHSGEGRYYYVGMGGFGARSFIGMVQQQGENSIWSFFAREREDTKPELNRTYRLRVECRGEKITLYEDGALLLTTADRAYRSGPWGLRTVHAQARFAGLRERSPSTLKAFVIMPFTSSLSFVYRLIEEVVTAAGLECHRVDESLVARPIIDDIKDWLRNADVIIADLTGRNPNVYYETGFAHALNKKLILLAQNEEDLAFNVRHVRTLFYASPDELRSKLEAEIKETVAGDHGAA